MPRLELARAHQHERVRLVRAVTSRTIAVPVASVASVASVAPNATDTCMGTANEAIGGESTAPWASTQASTSRAQYGQACTA
jgi:hypothetical protein